MDFKLRRIELDDAGLFCEALNSVILEKVYLGSAVEVSEESIRPFVESVINNHYPQAVAIADKKIVGWCDITPGRRTHTTHVGHLGMGVIASHRHHGIGSKLLQEGIAQAEKKPVRGAALAFRNNSTNLSCERRQFIQLYGIFCFVTSLLWYTAWRLSKTYKPLARKLT